MITTTGAIGIAIGASAAMSMCLQEAELNNAFGIKMSNRQHRILDERFKSVPVAQLDKG